MTAPVQESQVEQTQQSNKELNFRALETKYQRQLEQERAGRLEAERIAQEATSKRNQSNDDDDDDDNEPYVDKKKLSKALNKQAQASQSDIQKAMEIAKKTAKEELKQEMWLENNPDFYEILNHAEKFAQRAPKLAENILKMPEGFERQKLVYNTIKELGIDKPEMKQPSIQDKVDANKRSPFYQPSGIGSTPYSSQGDFTSGGQKNAYEKMQALIKNRRG